MRRHWFQSMPSHLDGRHPDRFDSEGQKSIWHAGRNAAFDVHVITTTCPTRIAWHESKRNTGVVMRKFFIFSALVFALVTGATATVVATTLQSQGAAADTTH
jgi:hypothetical protein